MRSSIEDIIFSGYHHMILVYGEILKSSPVRIIDEQASQGVNRNSVRDINEKITRIFTVRLLGIHDWRADSAG